jgi:predicted amidohydrolase YtcJ
MSIKSYNVLVVSILLFSVQPTRLFAQSADIVLINGKIFTADAKQPFVQALAIKGHKILAVGSNVAINKLATTKTKKVDLQGRTVVPGFNNAHDHPGWDAPIGKSYSYTEFNPAGPGKAAVLDSIARLAKTAKPREWISGMIGTAILFDTSMRTALDSIAPNNPVVLQIWWGHGQVINGKALETIGLSDNDKDPVGGWYIRSGSGKISGVQENAEAPLWFALTQSEPENLIKGMQSFGQQQVRAGITTVQYMGTGFKGAEAIHILGKANLPHRTRMISWPLSTSGGRQLKDWNIGNAQPTSLSYFSGVKYIIDGTPMEQNSLNKKPYKEGGTWYGRLNYPVDTMRQILQEALADDRQLMLHITGDSSFAIVLSLMKQLAKGEVWKSKRVRIEHNNTPTITEAEVKDVRELGLIMMHTPKYCQGSPVRSLIEKGITVGIAPDGTTNPFWDIMVVTSQQTNPKENITREQAVIAYTKTNAYAELKEKEKGTLTKGMLADLAVLSQDIFTISTERLPATTSIMTIVDGKIVHQQPNSTSPGK